MNKDHGFRFFEYSSSNKKMFSDNNLYIKLLNEKTNILFKTKKKFDPIRLNKNEVAKIIIMDDNLKQRSFTIKRLLKATTKGTK